ncbi:MAG: aminotransferase class I/II-fold pyridoxal phosphate-dependent enzyme [Haliangiales bacterium]
MKPPAKSSAKSPALHSPTIDTIPEYWYYRVDALLRDVKPPSDVQTVSLAAGAPGHDAPELINETIAAHGHLWHKYPPIEGSRDFREAVAEWLARRYGLTGIDPDANVMPVAGSREALFLTSMLAVPPTKAGARPAVLVPNPLYSVYEGAAIMSGAECVYLPATRATGFLPDIDAIDRDTLARTALVYLSSPANPQGVIASQEYLQAWIALAREHRFVLAVDECYCEIYDREPPVGVLQAAHAMGAGFSNVIALHSLSKRSSAPSLRSGFVAGDPDLLAKFKHLRTFSCATVPLPLLAASAAVWRDEEHVIESRAQYQRKFDLAEEFFGKSYGFYRPHGSFFTWLEVGDDEAVTVALWRQTGVKVMPGRYLGRPGPDGKNPGQHFIRVALVLDQDSMREVLSRVAPVLAESATHRAV